MSVVVSLKWSGNTKTRASQNSDTAQRIYTVVGAVSGDDAMNYVASTSLQPDGVTPYPGVAVGQNFGGGSILYCSNVSARDISVGVHEVTASFSVGNFTTSQDPLTLPWKYDWKTVTIEVPFDRDIDGNAVLQSARCAFTGNPTKRVSYKSLRIFRNESFYNYSTYKVFENTVNSDSVRLIQPNGEYSIFDPGTMFCASIEPGAAFTQKDKFVPMVLSFEIWDLSTLPSSVSDPFQFQALDQGSMGFYADPDNGGTVTRGNICDAKGNLVTADQNLDGTGLPTDTTLKIKGKNGVTYTPVTLGPSPPGAVVLNPTAHVYYLKYKRYASQAFLPIITEIPQ